MTAFWNDEIAFVHVPKCAGTSISKAFAGLPGRIDPKGDHGYENAAYYRDLVGAEVWDRKYSFAIVRNPWDRMASQYRFCVHKYPHKLDRIWPRQPRAEREADLRRCEESFDYWLLKYCEKGDGYWPLGLKRQNRPFTHVPQSWWIFDYEQGYSFQRVNEIFNFENLEKLPFKRYLWFSGLENHNATSNGEDYRTYYTDKSRDFIAEHFAEDIEKFGYEF